MAARRTAPAAPAAPAADLLMNEVAIIVNELILGWRLSKLLYRGLARRARCVMSVLVNGDDGST
jgi:hypothetical protein